jgi:predicted DNA-binding transcriptional regulator YafY
MVEKEEKNEYAQTERVFNILGLLQGESDKITLYNIKSRLGDQEGVTDRTIYRDLQFLKDRGYKIKCDRGEGYYLGDWKKVQILLRKLRKSIKKKP